MEANTRGILQEINTMGMEYSSMVKAKVMIIFDAEKIAIW